MKRGERGASAPAHPGLTPEELEPLYYREALRLHPRRIPAGGRGCSRARRSTRSCPSARRTRCTRALYLGASVGLVPRACCRSRSTGLVRLARAGRLPVALLLLAASVGPRLPRVLSAGAVPHPGDRSDADRRARGRPRCGRCRAMHAHEASSSSSRRTTSARTCRVARRAQILAHDGVSRARRGRRVARRHRRARRRPGARVSRAASTSCTGPASAASAARTSTASAARSRTGRRPDLPDGRRPLARSEVPARPRRGAPTTHDLVHRIALPERHQRRELAAAAASCSARSPTGTSAP